MPVKMKITVGCKTLTAVFDSNLEAMEVYTKLFDALLCGEDTNGFELSLEVEGNE